MEMFKFLFFVLSLSILIIGCKKNVPTNDSKTLLYMHKIDDVKMNEPISLTFGDDDVTTKVVWTILPNSNNSITTIANNATIEFAVAGTYTITASTQNVYAQYIITVGNKIYTPDYENNFVLIAKKLVKININEPILFKVFNPTTTNNIMWSVAVSNGGYTITKDNINKAATIFFTKSGFATITASDGVVAERRTIWIEDTTVINQDQLKTNFMLGEKLQLTPTIVTLNGIKKLVIAARTNRKYNCNSDIILSYNNNTDYQIDYAAVSISPTTCSTRSVASCENSFKNILIGTHPFAVNFANKTYTGTITLDALGKYTFGWNNASNVSIYPLSL